MSINSFKYGSYANGEDNSYSSYNSQNTGYSNSSSNWASAYKKALKRGSVDYSYYTYSPRNSSYVGESAVNSSKNRSWLDRTFDMLSVGQYATMGFLTNLFEDGGKVTLDKAFGQAWEGAKAGNPFGQGNEKGEYYFEDVLNKYTDWENWNPTWETDKLGTVGKFVGNLAGDILLDPLTYVTLGTGNLIRGTGKKTLSKTVEEVTQESVEAMAKKAGIQLSGDSVAKYTNKINSLRGINTNKTGLRAFGKTITSGETMRKIGDATVAPYYNSIRNSLTSSPVAKLFQTNYGLRQMAIANPEQAVRAMNLIDDARKLKLNKLVSNDEVKTWIKDVLDGQDEKVQRQIFDLLEDKNAWENVTTLSRAGDEQSLEVVRKAFDDYKSKYTFAGNEQVAKLSDEISNVTKMLDDDQLISHVFNESNPEMQRIYKEILDPSNKYQTYDEMVEKLGVYDAYDAMLNRESSFGEMVLKGVDDDFVAKLNTEVGEDATNKLLTYAEDYKYGRISQEEFEQVFDELYTNRIDRQNMYADLFDEASVKYADIEEANTLKRELDDLNKWMESEDYWVVKESEGLADETLSKTHSENVAKKNELEARIAELESKANVEPSFERTLPSAVADVEEVIGENTLSGSTYRARPRSKMSVDKNNAFYNTSNALNPDDLLDVDGYKSFISATPENGSIINNKRIGIQKMSAQDFLRITNSKITKNTNPVNIMNYVPRINTTELELHKHLLKEKPIFESTMNMELADKVKNLNDILFEGENVIAIPRSQEVVNRIYKAIRNGADADELKEMVWNASYRGLDVQNELARVYGSYRDMTKRSSEIKDRIADLLEKRNKATKNVSVPEHVTQRLDTLKVQREEITKQMKAMTETRNKLGDLLSVKSTDQLSEGQQFALTHLQNNLKGLDEQISMIEKNIVRSDGRSFNIKYQNELKDLQNELIELQLYMSKRNAEYDFAKNLTKDEWTIFKEVRGNSKLEDFDLDELKNYLKEKSQNMYLYENKKLYEGLDEIAGRDFQAKQSVGEKYAIDGDDAVLTSNTRNSGYAKGVDENSANASALLNAEQDAQNVKRITLSEKHSPIVVTGTDGVTRVKANKQADKGLVKLHGETVKPGYAGIDADDVAYKDALSAQIKEEAKADSIRKAKRHAEFEYEKLAKRIVPNIEANLEEYFRKNRGVLETVGKRFGKDNSERWTKADKIYEQIHKWLKGELKGASTDLRNIVDYVKKLDANEDVVIYTSSKTTSQILDPFKNGSPTVLTFNTPIVHGLPERATYLSLVAPQMNKRVFIKDATTGKLIMSNVGDDGRALYKYSVNKSAQGQYARIAQETQERATYDEVVKLVNEGRISDAQKLIPYTQENTKNVLRDIGFGVDDLNDITKAPAQYPSGKRVTNTPDVLTNEPTTIRNADKGGSEIASTLESKEVFDKVVEKDVTSTPVKPRTNVEDVYYNNNVPTYDIEKYVYTNNHFVDRLTGEVVEPSVATKNFTVDDYNPFDGTVNGESLDKLISHENEILDAFETGRITNQDELVKVLRDKKDALEGALYEVESSVNKLFDGVVNEDAMNSILETYSKLDEGVRYTYKNGETFVERTVRRLETDDVMLSSEVKSIASEIRERLVTMGIKEKSASRLENMINAYAPHVLNPDVVSNPSIMKKLKKQDPELYQKVLKSSGNKFNPFGISRSETLKETFGYTVREINEAMRPILKKAGVDGDFFINEIGDAYLTRALKHNEVMYSSRFADQLINEFGTRVTPTNLSGTKNYYIPQTSMRDILSTLDESVQEKVLSLSGFDVQRTYNKSLIKVSGEEFVKMSEVFDKYAQRIPSAYDIPEYLALKAENLGFTQQMKDTDAFIKMYDKFTTLWKNAVTVATPGFHIRNKFSNVFQNYLAVGGEIFNSKTRRAVKQIMDGEVGEFVTKSGRVISFDDIRNSARAYDVIGEDLFDSGKGVIRKSVFGEELSQEGTGLVQKVLGEGNSSILTKVDPTDTKNFFLYEQGRKVGSSIEEFDRMLNYVANLKNDLDFDEASDVVDKFLFDYGDLTNFEKTFMRRLVPFYTWIRKNAPLQIEQMLTNPGAYRFVAKTTNELNKNVDMNVMPEFMRDWVQLPITNGNDEIFFNPNMPYGQIQDAGELLNFTDQNTQTRRAVNMLNPAIKVPLELLQNKNYYFDSEIYNEQGEGIGDYLVGQTGWFNNAKKVADTVENGGNVNDYLNAFSYGTGVKLRSEDYDKYLLQAMRNRSQE